MNIVEELESLRRDHYECEDPWFSCPKSNEGCSDPSRGDVCTCGAEDHNAKLDAIIRYIRANGLDLVGRVKADSYSGELEIDRNRGVIYFHTAEDEATTLLRICSLPTPIPQGFLDIFHMKGQNWRVGGGTCFDKGKGCPIRGDSCP